MGTTVIIPYGLMPTANNMGVALQWQPLCLCAWRQYPLHIRTVENSG